MGLTRLLAVVQADNQASLALLERLGFRAESTVRLAVDDLELLVYAARPLTQFPRVAKL